MLKVFAALLVAIVSLLSILWFNSSLQPVVWAPNDNPKLTGVYTANNELDKSQLILQDVGVGPEDIVLGPDNRFYTGFSDGRIVSFTLNGSQSEDIRLVTNTGGRPLGIKFDHNKNLIVTDVEKGLLSINASGNIRVLTDSVNGVKMKFIDHLDIAQDGTIWFSDATQRFDINELTYNFVEMSATGRLLSYSPKTKKTQVELTNLYFANGVVLGPNDDYVLVNETAKAQIRRLWLKGEKKGQSDIFIKNLPAMPDNLSFNGTDTFWVALINLREPLVDGLAQYPVVRKFIGGLPADLLRASKSYGFVIGVNLQGEVIYNLQGNKTVHSLTSAIEHNGALIVGSLTMPHGAIFKLTDSVFPPQGFN